MTETQDLSEREIEILALVATGKSNKEIAQVLYISSNTVKVHLRNIFAKLGVTSRTEASMVAYRDNLIASPAPPVSAEAPPPPSEPPAPLQPAPTQPSLRPLLLGAAIVLLLIILGTAAFRAIQAAAPASATVIPEQVTVESRWNAHASLPSPRTGLAAVTLNDSIYVIGGEVDGLPTGELLRFDPATAQWETLAPKPTPVRDIQAAVLGGRIYVPGGEVESGGVSASLEIYNPGDDSWSQGSALPVGLSAYSLAAFEGKLYLFGGWDGSSFVGRVFSFDPDLNVWEEKSSLPTARGFSGAAVIGGKIFVIGGFDGKSAFSENWMYSPERDHPADSPWNEAAPLPEGRYTLGLVSLADKIHLIGGKGASDGNFSQMDYTPQSDTWQILDNPLAGEWYGFGTALVGTQIFALGGEQDGRITDQNLAYTVVFVVVIPVIK